MDTEHIAITEQINLKDPKGLEVSKRLAEKDVQNFCPDVKRLGIDYGFDQIAQGTVWLTSITGFISVERGPMPSEKPHHDRQHFRASGERRHDRRSPAPTPFSSMNLIAAFSSAPRTSSSVRGYGSLLRVQKSAIAIWERRAIDPIATADPAYRMIGTANATCAYIDKVLCKY